MTKFAVGGILRSGIEVNACRQGYLGLSRKISSLRALDSAPREQADMVDVSERSSRGATLFPNPLEKSVIDSGSAVQPGLPEVRWEPLDRT